MRFIYHHRDDLPRLAWCAEMTAGAGTVEVFHGPWLETRTAFFVEGAWNGSFEDGAFDRADLFMGSGGRVSGERVVFATPSHTLERLFIVRDDSRVTVSPSLAFLLTRTGEHLDPRHVSYQADLLRLVLRMKNHVGTIPLVGNRHVTVVHYRNVIVDRDLTLHVEQKPRSRPFVDFGDYKDFLTSGLHDILRNAQAPTRRHVYEPVVTVSSGYDSSACAAIASEVGCSAGVTFRDARQKGENDSGLRTGRMLGLEMREFDRAAYAELPGFPEAEFLATGDLGQDLVMSAFQDDFPGRCVIVGTHGDRVWDCHAKSVSEDIVRHDMAACCLTDFKFRIGFVLVPLAFFGCTSHPSLHRISHSQEMAPWRLGTAYDRPIPRRLVEERGVPRTMFGQRKKQVTVLLNSDRNIRHGMTRESRASFEAFYQQHRARRSPSTQLVFRVLHALHAASTFASMKLHGLSSRLGHPVCLPSPIPLRYQKHPGRASFLVHWALPLVQARYLAASRQMAAPGVPSRQEA